MSEQEQGTDSGETLEPITKRGCKREISRAPRMHEVETTGASFSIGAKRQKAAFTRPAPGKMKHRR